MLGSRLILAVAIILIFAKVQCVSACSLEACGFKQTQTEKLPPCHKHKQASKACGHDVTAATFSQSTPIDASALAVSIDAMTIEAPGHDFGIQIQVAGSSPPPYPRLNSSTLRI